MELRQLEYFIVVAEELHFGRAASRLNMTQPPLSQQIQQLEREVGVRLLDRTKRRVELTRAGAAFLGEARAAVDKVEEAVEIARRTERGQVGRLNVGFVGSATYELLPRVVRAYRHKFPDVEVMLRELPTPLQVEALERGDIDVGVIRPPISSTTVNAEVIQRERCVVVLPINHPLAEKPRLFLRELSSEQLITVTRSTWPGYYDELIGLCREEGFSPTIYQEATEFQTVIGLVAAGVGVAVVPASAENFHARDVVYRPFTGAAPNIEMAVAWRTEDTSAIVRHFMEVTRDIVATGNECAPGPSTATFP